jgi:excisionase family DNA binding protein
MQTRIVTVSMDDLVDLMSTVVRNEVQSILQSPMLGEGFKDEVLDRKQAAQLLKLSEQTLTKLYLEGRVTGQKSGSQYRFLKSSIVNYLSTKNI